jgi:hypothetical protein
MIDAAHLPRRLAFPPVFTCILLALLFAGCGKSADVPQNQTSVVVTNTAPPSPTPEVAGPPPGEQVCFACKGEGTVPCRVPGCVDGKVDCPGSCLKLSKGVWKHTDIDGNPSDMLWQYFTSADGRMTMGWSEHHLGEVIVMQDGKPTDIGQCKICGGTTKVTCSVCKGTGKVTCPICNGKKYIPPTWTPTNNPWFNSLPDVIRLADGRVVLGRIAATVGDDLTIVTRDKKILHVKASDILPKLDTNSPAVLVSPAK